MVTLRKILVAVDFGDSTSRILEFARFLADASGASLHLIHVVGQPLGTPDGRAEAARIGCQLDALLDQADRTRRHATTACVVGSAPAEIVRYAAEQGVDLLVMGTHPHGPAFQMVRSSLAELVLGTAPCAVLAIKGDVAAATGVGVEASTSVR